MKKINLLWSGGWDGTFRFLQLCQYDIEIQPIYIIDDKRKSSNNERDSMKQIIELAKKQFKATILDVKFYDKKWVLENCKNDEISEAFAYLRNKYRVGTQYEWFALLTKYLGDEKMESAVVHQYHGKVEEAIEGESSLLTLTDDVLEDRYVVDAKDGNKAHKVFENIILPVIKLSKMDEYEIAKENGWLDIMKLSWFCHSPIKGKPCGLCGPCDDAMNTGMDWRMPKESQRRYRHRGFYSNLIRIKKKLGME